MIYLLKVDLIWWYQEASRKTRQVTARALKCRVLDNFQCLKSSNRGKLFESFSVKLCGFSVCFTREKSSNARLGRGVIVLFHEEIGGRIEK